MTRTRETTKPERPEPIPAADGERDFGDSAGYGSGGSTLDRHEVGDVDPAEDARPNPLDDVTRPRKSR